jgi:membrane-anchored protein YejM (alkaline phosphatase superfamily)
MTTSNLIRWSGLGAMVAGMLNVLDGIFEPLPWLTILSAAVTVFALIGIYAVQVEESGWLGFAGYLLWTVSFVFMAGTTSMIGSVPSFLVGIILGATGLVLLAVGTLSARVFPRWVPGLWIAAIVIGLPSLLFPSLERPLEILGAAAIGVGMVGAGYVLWSSDATLAAAQ